jgi:hypothetical protein
MDNKITDALKTATKDILTEDVLKEIESAFNASVDEKVKLHVEKALMEQDSDYSKKLETLLEALDTDHTNKLKMVVEAIDSDRANKLKAVVSKYENALNLEAKNFKDTLVEQVSKYLEAYLDEKVPATEINEAVKNKRAISVLEEIRKLLSVDMALANDNIRDAVVDGKQKIDEAATQLEAANKQVNKLSDENKKLKANLVLETKVSNLDEDKKSYMKKMLANRTAEFITENFDYTLKLYEKTEEERLVNLKSEALTEASSNAVDRPVIEESAVTGEEAVDPSFNNYLSELQKY